MCSARAGVKDGTLEPGGDMVRYVALLRGVNVGGHRRVPMAGLRQLLSDLHYGDPATYLQSGNALFSSESRDVVALTREIEDAIEHELGFHVDLLLRSAAELAALIAGNPFPEAEAFPKILHVAFLSAAADPERLRSIDAQAYLPDRFALGDRAIYLGYAAGAGRTRLTPAVWERRLGLWSTARNWNTITSLLDLARSSPAQ